MIRDYIFSTTGLLTRRRNKTRWTSSRVNSRRFHSILFFPLYQFIIAKDVSVRTNAKQKCLMKCKIQFCFYVRPCSRSKTPLYKPLALIIYSCKYLKTPHHTLYVYVSYTYTHPSTMSLRYTLGPRRRSSRRLSPRRKFPKHFSYN